MKGAFLEAQPDVGVELAGFFKPVLLQIEDQQLPAWPQDARGLVDCGLGVLRVVEGLREDREIDGLVGQRNRLDVSELVGEVGQAIAGGEVGADLDHARGVVDAPDLLGATGEELGNKTLAGAEVGDGDARDEAQGEMADGLP